MHGVVENNYLEKVLTYNRRKKKKEKKRKVVYVSFYCTKYGRRRFIKKKIMEYKKYIKTYFQHSPLARIIIGYIGGVEGRISGRIGGRISGGISGGRPTPVL
jgi:hypothetical protein